MNDYELEQLIDEQLVAITAHRGLMARYGEHPTKEMLYTLDMMRVRILELEDQIGEQNDTEARI